MQHEFAIVIEAPTSFCLVQATRKFSLMQDTNNDLKIKAEIYEWVSLNLKRLDTNIFYAAL